LFYFPLVLVPKLLASPDELDFYYQSGAEGGLGWVAHVNTVLLVVTGVEFCVVVVMSVARYVSAKYSSVPAPVLYIFSYVLIIFVLIMSFVPIFLFDQDGVHLIKHRITQDILTINTEFNKSIYKPALKCKTIVLAIFAAVGLMTSILMMVRLVKKRDCLDRQFQICTCLMNLWNIVVSLILVSYLVIASKRSKVQPPQFSTSFDFFIFSATYGFPLTQSVVNTICIAGMKDFRGQMFGERKVTPQEIDNPSSAI
jgi:hypothetical protein